MSSLTVTVERLVIHEHPNADLLELAQVGLYRAVVPKGEYRTGDYAIYIPEQAIVPAELLEEIGLTGKLGGKQHDRVCTVRLRGEISQGVVCRPKAITEMFGGRWEDGHVAHAAGTDFAEVLGITKWVPPIPVHLTGEMEPGPELLRWVDIENIRRYPDIFTPGEDVIATEKVHGTCCLFTLDVASDRALVTSKGFGDKALVIKASETNLYWRAVRLFDVEKYARDLAASLGASRIGIFGEVYGQGIQDLGYGQKGSIGYAVFDVRVEEDGQVYWVSHADLPGLLKDKLPSVPQLYRGPYDEAKLIELAEGIETISGTNAHIREGIVVRPAVERYSGRVGGRAIGKLVSTAYLTRKGGTEYE